ncbi:hypothetical protein Ptc2401_00823 [Prosthecochloris sp. CIB 2401]|nr:hypothetical protein Ptc2401_00823 [Prosthecochloris sp. CIB 2401]
MMGDTPMWLLVLRKSKIYYDNECTAVYRLSVDSMTRSVDIKKRLRFALSMFEMRVFFVNKYGIPISQYLIRAYNDALIRYRVYDWDYRIMYPLFPDRKSDIIKYNIIKLSLVRSALRIYSNLIRGMKGIVRKVPMLYAVIQRTKNLVLQRF